MPEYALCSEIQPPEIVIHDNDIIVNTGISFTEDIEASISSGIEKEVVFTIELFRAWRFWPDEFVVSRKIKKTIKYDGLRGYFYVSIDDGKNRVERRFRDFNKNMKEWFFRVNNVDLANIKELDKGDYYIRVIVESKSREVPAVIGLLMFFIPEVEMSLATESQALLHIGKDK
jgi:hypothetical protein